MLVFLGAIVVGCDRNRVGDEEGYVEPEATERSTIKTGTSERDAQTADPGSATGPAGETSGGTFGTGQHEPGTGGSTIPGQTSTNIIQPAPKP
ncbi:MAG: hypothetical protein H0X66_11555 [Verrucomicrobia bacterium]|nr:hypothetical protein [Verrucomicrobiota bacterium]